MLPREKDSKFQPSENQLAVLQGFQALNYCGTVAQGCKPAGVNRDRWYKWHRECVGFSEWWQAEAGLWSARQLPSVYGAMLRSATGSVPQGQHSGNAKDREIFLNRFDKEFIPKSKKVIDARIEADVDQFEERKADLLAGYRRDAAERAAADAPAAPAVSTGDASTKGPADDERRPGATAVDDNDLTRSAPPADRQRPPIAWPEPSGPQPPQPEA